MNQAIVRGIILLLGVLVAFVVGSATANYDITFLMLGGVCFGALLFVGIVWRYVLPLALFISIVGFSWYPMGVALGPDELSYILVLALIGARIWRPFDSRPRLDSSTDRALRFFTTTSLVWVAFVFGELVWRLLETRFYGEPGMRNVLKSYVSILVPTFCIVYFILRPSAIVALKNPGRVFLWMLLISLFVGVVLRFYQNSFGGSILDEQSGRLIAGPFIVPGIAVVEGIYVLRNIGPLSVLTAMLFLTVPKASGERRMILLPAAVLSVGLVACFASGGRASIALAALYLIGVLILRRSLLGIAGAGIAAVVIFLMVNAAHREIEQVAPPNVVRSINWMIIGSETSASGDIDASTRWRTILFEESIEVWRSSWRNIVIGRGYRGLAETDYMDQQSAGYYEMIDAALQRGATHSLLSDALLCFGVVGAVIYYLLLGSQCVFGLAVTRNPIFSEETKRFAWITAANAAHGIVVGSLGGSFLGMLNALVVIITVLQCYRETRARAHNGLSDDPFSVESSQTYSAR